MSGIKCSTRCFLWWSEHPYDEANGLLCAGCREYKGKDGLTYRESCLVDFEDAPEPSDIRPIEGEKYFDAVTYMNGEPVVNCHKEYHGSVYEKDGILYFSLAIKEDHDDGIC